MTVCQKIERSQFPWSYWDESGNGSWVLPSFKLDRLLRTVSLMDSWVYCSKNYIQNCACYLLETGTMFFLKRICIRHNCACASCTSLHGVGNQMVVYSSSRVYCMDKVCHKPSTRFVEMLVEKEHGNFCQTKSWCRNCKFCPVTFLWCTGLCHLALSAETLSFTPNNSSNNGKWMKLHLKCVCMGEYKFTSFPREKSWLLQLMLGNLRQEFLVHLHTLKKGSLQTWQNITLECLSGVSFLYVVGKQKFTLVICNIYFCSHFC